MPRVTASLTILVGFVILFWLTHRLQTPDTNTNTNAPDNHFENAATMPPRYHWANPMRNVPRWAAVDAYALHHTHPATRPNAKTLQSTLAASSAAGLPDYALSPAQAKFLALHCRAAGVTHALEVGTLGGYTAIWLASENPGLRVTTVEYRRKHVEVARGNIERAGLAGRIEVVRGDGAEVLERLRGEVRGGTREPFGFVFIDADKTSSWTYFKLAKDMVKANSVICVDNVVREGQLADLDDTDPDVVGSRRVVEKVGKEPGVDSVVMQTVGEKSYDGWLWAVVTDGISQQK